MKRSIVMATLSLALGAISSTTAGAQQPPTITTPPGFKGTIKLDVRDSKADWEPYTPKKAPAGAPNILIVLYDAYRKWVLPRMIAKGVLPKGLKAQGEVRNQYHHAVDIVPTILDICGLEMPKVYKGVEQYPLSGVSMRYTFDAAPDAPTQKHRQYYAMLGTRAMWEDGWKAVALHAPIVGKGHFDQDQWELYRVAADPAESKDLAKENPEKLQQLIKAWFEEADKNLVLPLDDRGALEVLGLERPSEEPARERYVYYADGRSKLYATPT